MCRSKRFFFSFEGERKRLAQFPAVRGNIVCILPRQNRRLVINRLWSMGCLWTFSLYPNMIPHTKKWRKCFESAHQFVISEWREWEINVCIIFHAPARFFFVCYEHCFNNIGAIFPDTPYFESLTLARKLFLLHYLWYSNHRNFGRQSDPLIAIAGLAYFIFSVILQVF